MRDNGTKRDSDGATERRERVVRMQATNFRDCAKAVVLRIFLEGRISSMGSDMVRCRVDVRRYVRRYVRTRIRGKLQLSGNQGRGNLGIL